MCGVQSNLNQGDSQSARFCPMLHPLTNTSGVERGDDKTVVGAFDKLGDFFFNTSVVKRPATKYEKRFARYVNLSPHPFVL